jgi:hypothetical protein
MDRTRRRTTGRSLVGLVVVAAALYGAAAAASRVDTHAAADAPHSGSRQAAVHEHASTTLRALLPMRSVDRAAKSGLRETFALAVCALVVALAFGARRRVRRHAPQILPASVRFGAPRAPPALQLQP